MRKNLSAKPRSAFIGGFIFSCAINILALTAPIFMVEVYDRVIPSGSLPTLVALLVLVATSYVFASILEIVRSRLMSRTADLINVSLNETVFDRISRLAIQSRTAADTLKPAQDLEQVRAFLAGPGMVALFDLPWMPVYLILCFFIHPLIGWVASGAMIVLAALTFLTDVMTWRSVKNSSDALALRNKIGEAAHGNADILSAMGMRTNAFSKWDEAQTNYAAFNRKISDTTATMSATSKMLRSMVQSGVLGLGAYLVVAGELSAGMILASNIIAGRALAPAEQVISNWRRLTAARQAWQRLKATTPAAPFLPEQTSLPAPCKRLSVEKVSVAPPGTQRFVLQNVSFALEAGSITGIIGSSGSGKSSLARALIGIWPTLVGEVRLDGATLEQWPSDERGRHIGYMSQNSELFPGTIAENISRLGEIRDDAALIAAAQAAGVHDLIVSLPSGYETLVGERGENLSAGQRQRIALARALYGDPFLVVLDEPNSNLDLHGDRALAGAIAAVKARGGIVIIIAHRNSILSLLDFLLVIESGTARAFGPRDAVLKSMTNEASRLANMPHELTRPIAEREGA